MESTTFRTNRLLLLLLVTGIGATLVAWQQKQKNQTAVSPPVTTKTDTLPKDKIKKELKVRNLDEALEDLDRVHVDIDLEKLNMELDKIAPDVQVQVEKALKAIDMVKIKTAVDASLASIDWPSIKVDVNNSLSKIDWDQMKVDVEKLKDIKFDKLDMDMKNLDVELKKIKPNLEKNLKDAKIGIEKAKAELKEYKHFVDGLENDGLIDKKGNYSIRNKNGELYINGKVQPAEVYNKYREFLDKHKTLTIEKSDDDFNVNND